MSARQPGVQRHQARLGAEADDRRDRSRTPARPVSAASSPGSAERCRCGPASRTRPRRRRPPRCVTARYTKTAPRTARIAAADEDRHRGHERDQLPERRGRSTGRARKTGRRARQEERGERGQRPRRVDRHRDSRGRRRGPGLRRAPSVSEEEAAESVDAEGGIDRVAERRRRSCVADEDHRSGSAEKRRPRQLGQRRDSGPASPGSGRGPPDKADGAEEHEDLSDARASCSEARASRGRWPGAALAVRGFAATSISRPVRWSALGSTQLTKQSPVRLRKGW